jgi:hypothetical protein
MVDMPCAGCRMVVNVKRKGARSNQFWRLRWLVLIQ